MCSCSFQFWRDLDDHLFLNTIMPARKGFLTPGTTARTPSLAKAQDVSPYPTSRPTSTRTGTSNRPRTARPRTATSTTGSDSHIIAAVTEGTYTLMYHLGRTWYSAFSWNLLPCFGHRRWYLVRGTPLLIHAYRDLGLANIYQDNPQTCCFRSSRGTSLSDCVDDRLSSLTQTWIQSPNYARSSRRMCLVQQSSQDHEDHSTKKQEWNISIEYLVIYCGTYLT